MAKSDADMGASVANILGSAYGCAGQRCLAGSVVVAVGAAYEPLKAELVKRAANLRVGYGLEETTQMGTVISASARERIEKMIQAGVDDGARATHRRLSVAELEAVAASGCVRIGSHTVSHAHLSHLAVEEQRREIGDSRRRLEEIVGEAVDHFSYPHGDFTSDTVALVREAGFRVACGTACAPVLPGADLFRLPRVEVPDVDGDAFTRWLDEWVG
jgi:hypothetical protein